MTEDGNSLEEKIQAVIDSKHGSQLVKRIDELKNNKEIIDAEHTKYDQNYEIASRHDSLITVCASTFGPESQCAQELGYYFVSSEPLAELSVKNYDVLVYNPNLKKAIFIECKSSISRAGKIVNELYEAKEQVENNKEYLEEKIGGDIESLEFVICVPTEYTNTIAQEFEKREKDGTIDEDIDGLFLIWQVNRFFDDSLQLFTRISRDKEYDCQHKDRDLTRLLGKGCNVSDSEVIIKFNMSSHPQKKNIQIVAHIAKKCLHSESSIEFSQALVEEFCTSESTLVHYSRDEIGSKIADAFLRENKELELIEPIEDKNGCFKLKIKGKTLGTIIKNYEKEYKEKRIKKNILRVAQKKAYDEIKSTQLSLFSFD